MAEQLGKLSQQLQEEKDTGVSLSKKLSDVEVSISHL